MVPCLWPFFWLPVYLISFAKKTGERTIAIVTDQEVIVGQIDFRGSLAPSIPAVLPIKTLQTVTIVEPEDLCGTLPHPVLHLTTNFNRCGLLVTDPQELQQLINNLRSQTSVGPPLPSYEGSTHINTSRMNHSVIEKHMNTDPSVRRIFVTDAGAQKSSGKQASVSPVIILISPEETMSTLMEKVREKLGHKPPVRYRFTLATVPAVISDVSEIRSEDNLLAYVEDS